MSDRPDIRALEHDNATLRTRVDELERKLARFRGGEDEPTGTSLAEREALLSEAERIVHMGSWVWDPASGGVTWSDEMFRIYGYAPGAFEPTAEAFYAGVHEDDLPRVLEGAKNVVATGRTAQELFRVVRPSGEIRHITMNSAVLFDESGAPRRVVGTLLDTTERINLEEQLRHAQKMEAIGRLAGGVAHDFNNLLTVILGNVGLLRDNDPSSELEDIATAAESAASLTRQLLAFSRRAVLDRQALDVNEAIRSAEGLLRKAVGEEVELHLDFAPSLWLARLDRGQLHQILMNLAVNARDAMPEGGRLEVCTQNRTWTNDDGDTLEGVSLRVTDTGRGMDEATAERMFDPFFTTKASGTGLGLAMVFGAVQQSGGEIRVESKPGGGTRFEILFPRDAETKQADPETTSSETPLARLGKGVLLVDDDAMVARVVASYLRRGGVEVVEAGSPGKALELLAEREFDLVISDMIMPGMHGDELGVEIRKTHGDLPIVFMTGNSAEVLDEGSFPQPWSLVRKPVRGSEILAAVGKFFGRSETVR